MLKEEKKGKYKKNMIFCNVTLKALNSRFQENLKNSMTMDMHRKFIIYKIIHLAHIKHVYDLIFKENPIIADLGAWKSNE